METALEVCTPKNINGNSKRKILPIIAISQQVLKVSSHIWQIYKNYRDNATLVMLKFRKEAMTSCCSRYEM
jgi:hypothetical protein